MASRNLVWHEHLVIKGVLLSVQLTIAATKGHCKMSLSTRTVVEHNLIQSGNIMHLLLAHTITGTILIIRIISILLVFGHVHMITLSSILFLHFVLYACKSVLILY